LNLSPQRIRDEKRRKAAASISDFCEKENVAVCDYLKVIALGERRFYRWKEVKKLHTVSLELEMEFDTGCRESAALPAAPPPEPKASEPDGIRSHIKSLAHKKKRTLGSGELYQKYKGKISRREFQKMIKEEREQKKDTIRRKMTRVEWLLPTVCWAFDDTFLATDKNGKKVWIHNIKDLASQYILPPMAGEFKDGKEVARNLQNLFIQFGAPMFLKRDNGPNLNSKEVKEVLEHFHVTVINSPEYYSQYNGSIEQANGLLKKEVDLLAKNMDIEVDVKNITPLARLAAHELNIRYRKSMKDFPVCLFWRSKKESFKYNNIPKRKEVFNEISAIAQKMLDKLSDQEKSDIRVRRKCRRKAAEEILQKRGYIRVYKN